MIKHATLNKKKFFIGAAILLVLAAAFWYGGNSPSSRGWGESSNKGEIGYASDKGLGDEINQDYQPDGTTESVVVSSGSGASSSNSGGTFSSSGSSGNSSSSGGGSSSSGTGDKGTGKSLSCVISISCSTILDNIGSLKESKKSIVPSDGWILKSVEVDFNQGDTVFDVLLAVTRKYSIHMEYSKSPMYNSMYIEGIGNLYEYDCGDLSGWMYKVNDYFPNYGCSQYTLEDGDVIEWVYTCDLGNDVGGGYSTGN